MSHIRPYTPQALAMYAKLGYDVWRLDSLDEKVMLRKPLHTRPRQSRVTGGAALLSFAKEPVSSSRVSDSLFGERERERDAALFQSNARRAK